MSYEYKEEILLDIGPEPNCNYGSEYDRYYDKVDELDHIYEQAAKADEYEAKAKAFDRIVKESKGAFSCGDFCDDVRHIINSYEIGVKADD